MSELWTEKYNPKNYDEFIGNHEIRDHFIQWAKNWENGKKSKPLLLYGQSGSGKTCLAYLVAKQMGWQIFELNASDLRSKDKIEKYAGGAALNSSFSGKLRLVLIDEVDGFQRKDSGGLPALVQVIKEANNPIILTANDIYADKKLATLRSYCELLEFKKINYLSMGKRLKEILDGEKAEYDDEAVKELAKNASGDFRSALLDAQTLALNGKIVKEDLECLANRERQEKIFKTMEKIFKGKTFAEIKEARNKSDISYDLLGRWVEENIPRIYNKDNDTANAFEKLSRADIFTGRIMRRQHYIFLKYYLDLMTSGVALSRENDYHGWLKFQFPTLLSKLSRSSAKRALKKELGKKIGRKTHSSIKDVLTQDLEYLKILYKDKKIATDLTALFDLEDKEVAFLMNTKPETKKVQKILEEAEQIKKEIIIEKRKRFVQNPQNMGLKHFTEDEKKEDPPESDIQENQTALSKFM